MTNRNDNRERKNKYPKNNSTTIQKDSTPEENNSYGTKSHKN
ncbi:hypothetical protein [Bacillus kexueae]|nr:hypothetical protein [Bacillus kexueae]